MGTTGGSLADLKIDRSESERISPWPLLLALLALGAVAAGGWWWFSRPRPVEVRTLLVQETSAGGSGRPTLLNASGYLVARRQATVSSKVTGKVIQVLVEEGRKVEAGQELARLDDSNLQAALNLATAQVESVRAALKETEVRIAEAAKDHGRFKELAAKGIATSSDLDRAEAELHALEARLERQQRDIIVAERQVEQIQQELDDLIIRAPFSGMVTSKSAQPGEMISPISAGGGYTRTGICTIVDMSSLEIEVDVSESYINRVQPGQAVEATLDAYPDWRIPCKVIAIIPTADRQKATVKVRIAFDRLDPRLLPDMGVKVAFLGETVPGPAGAAAGGLRIPRTAVRQADGKHRVFVVQDQRAEERAVKLEDIGGDEFLVLAGLRAGERLVTDVPGNLKDGNRIREKPE